MKPLGLLVLTCALATAQTNDPEQLISRAQETLASQLDSALPQLPFGKWLRSQVGDDAIISWTVRVTDDTRHPSNWVEADVWIQGSPSIVIMIEKGTSFHSMQLVRTRDYDEWSRLRDLPQALQRARR